MKIGPSYVWLPFVATGVNFLFACFALPARHADGQPIVLQNDAVVQIALQSPSCQEGTTEEECLYDLTLESTSDETLVAPTIKSNGTIVTAVDAQEENDDDDDDEDEKDPMLRKMPGLDFEAYVRADISSFYRQEEGSMVEVKPRFTGQAGKFVNMSPQDVSLYWVGNDGKLSPISSYIPAWGSGGTSTFPTHQFVFTPKRRPDNILCTFTVRKGTSVYYYDPYTSPKDEDDFDPARCEPPEGTTVQDVDLLSAEDREKYRQHKFNFAFAALYKTFTNGSEWLTMYPKNKPQHKIWRADYFGQEHHVLTEESHFHTDPGAALTEHTLSLDEMRRANGTLPLAEFRQPGLLNMTLKAISCAPRAFEIRNFLSDAEVDHMLKLVKKQTMSRSSTGEQGSGSHVSEVRTSRNTWLPRNKDTILNTIYRRAAEALRMDEALLRDREEHELPNFPNKRAINEQLQVVHYEVGQEYTAHHDFGYPRGDDPNSPSRSINVCMYLNDVPKGGETSFPRWRNAETDQAIKVKPEKGKAVIFYMVNPDGNLDDLTQHAALPVIEGEKYFVNLWIHDPYYS